jgi:hypothetical protein
MQAFMGLEAEPGSQNKLHEILKAEQIEAYLTRGGHDIVCRLPEFSDLKEYRKLVDRILFTKDEDRAIVANVTSYVVLDRFEKKSGKLPSAFCFVRSGRLPSRDRFDQMLRNVYKIDRVLSVSVVIGFFDLVCEIEAESLAELKQTIDQILSTPGVSSRAVMVCMVLGS